MNYHHNYNRLVANARIRQTEGYVEQHHILPRCIGGDDSPANLVVLTPEEHFVAHKLLVKMHPGNQSLLRAAWCMTNGSGKQPGRTNKLYGWLKRRFAEEMSRQASKRTYSPETRAKMRAAKLGKKRPAHTPETKAKMAAASKGRPKSEEHRAKLAAAKLGKKRGPHSEETRRKITESNRISATTRDFSFMQDESYRQAQASRMKQVWEQRRSNVGPQPPAKGGDDPEEV